jgi:hypothetical protein
LKELEIFYLREKIPARERAPDAQQISGAPNF